VGDRRCCRVSVAWKTFLQLGTTVSRRKTAGIPLCLPGSHFLSHLKRTLPQTFSSVQRGDIIFSSRAEGTDSTKIHLASYSGLPGEKIQFRPTRHQLTVGQGGFREHLEGREQTAKRSSASKNWGRFIPDAFPISGPQGSAGRRQLCGPCRPKHCSSLGDNRVSVLSTVANFGTISLSFDWSVRAVTTLA